MEYFSRIFGTPDVIKETKQVDTRALFLKDTGLGSERLSQSFVVHPSDIKKLGQGEGFVTPSDLFSKQELFKIPRIPFFAMKKGGGKNSSSFFFGGG